MRHPVSRKALTPPRLPCMQCAGAVEEKKEKKKTKKTAGEAE